MWCGVPFNNTCVITGNGVNMHIGKLIVFLLVTGDMPWQDVLCCKKKLELVLGTFASLEENYRILMSK